MERPSRSERAARNLASTLRISSREWGQQGAPTMLQLHLQDLRHADIELLAAKFHKRPLSITFVIGGKLRALLEDQVTPPPDRLSDLLVALHAGGTLAADSPHCP